MPGEIEPDQAIDAAIHAQPGNQRLGIGVGKGRAVAQKFRDDMNIADQCRQLLRPAAALGLACKPATSDSALGLREVARRRRWRDDIARAGRWPRRRPTGRPR